MGEGCPTLRCPTSCQYPSASGGCNVLTSEVLQQLNLSQRSLGQDLLAEDVCDLLDGDALATLVVGGRTRSGIAISIGSKVGSTPGSYHTIPYAPWPSSAEGKYVSATLTWRGTPMRGSRSQNSAERALWLYPNIRTFCHIVPLVDDKLLVEHLEDLAVV